ncbi:P-loop containing nucleoside triphosphate hydrolase protein [Halteromyces radiatus]|uniref:P-loop containing nucleoside triphosphate hydrolase protein n=1 Tax=Halteromyces radiatus TaxID=101107 RepID=UPI002221010F|nr:P-loop containing nucleoside triphosphate hydrolase protein [Halteromyces radiatus]KAI8081656.1 P-loop containing nucleoside triphosphate hydrolase protein [Halteromyces radiatus]
MEYKKEKSQYETKLQSSKQKSITIYRLFRFASKKDILMITVAILCSIVIGAIQPLGILIFGKAIDTFALEADTSSNLVETVRPIIYWFIIMGIVAFVAAYVSNCCWVLSGENQTRRIRLAYVHAVLRQDMSWFDIAGEGSLTTRLVADTQMIQDGISDKCGAFVMSMARFITGFLVAFIINWRLAIVILTIVPLLAGFGAVMSFLITRYTIRIQNAYADAGTVAEQALGGIRTVHAYSLQNRFTRLYDDKLQVVLSIGVRRAVVVAVGYSGLMFIMFGTYALSLWYGSQLMYQRILDGQTVVTVIIVMLMSAISLMQLPAYFSTIIKGRAAATKLFSIIDHIPNIDSDHRHKERDTIQGHIQFRNVHFAYPTRPDIPVLQGFDLTIHPGMTVAFVGSSGSGKSTSIQLLQRFYDPVQGNILVDGEDIKESWDVQALRQHIGVVGQEPVLFNMTVRENICMGAKQSIENNSKKDPVSTVSEDQIIAACRQANCHVFITELPQGYDTMIKEGMLSGGQKQRIAIARAILKNPSILLLDEATSALDTTSEKIVQHAIDSASRNRTTIIVAHRLSTVRHADLIVVMDKGRLAEQGTHIELLSHGGIYAELVSKQAIATKCISDDHISSTLSKDSQYLEEDTIIVNTAENTDISLDHRANSPTMKQRQYRSLPMNNQYQHSLQQQRQLSSHLQSSSYRTTIYVLFEIVRQMRPEWHLLLMGSVCACASGIIFPVYATIVANVIIIISQPDFTQHQQGPFQSTNLYSILFLIIGIWAFLSIGGRRFAFELAGERYMRRLRYQLFSRLLAQEIGFFDQEENSVGALSSRLAMDVKNVTEMVITVWGEFIQLLFTACAGLAIAFAHSWVLTLIMQCMIPCLVLSTAYESVINRRFHDKTKKAYEQSSQVANEAIREIRTVASLTRQAYFEQRYADATLPSHALAQRKAYLTSLGYAFSQATNIFTNAVAFYAGAIMISHGSINMQQMFVTLMTVLITAEGIGHVSTFTGVYAKAKQSTLTTFEVLFRKPAIDPDLEGNEPKTVDGQVDFSNIAFRYPARPQVPIFNGDFHLPIKAGRTIALVGHSGCGKSTTIGLLQRWYDPISGVVSLDEKNVQSFTLNNLRSHMALVGQEPMLFDLTIRENILFGVEESNHITQQDIENTCRTSNIHTFIMNLPDGYDTRVGDKGSQLSGGQKQRIAIARALIRQPKVLLLDEATSALDSDSEKLVQDAIDRILEQKNRTTITIAHRLSTIQKADVICVVKDGRIIEHGSHWELLDLKGVYATLVHQQSLSVN